MKYLVAQLGARMHYAIPRMLHDAGMLSHFYTDICAVKGWPRLLKAMPDALQPKGLKRLLGRVPEGVPSKDITAFTKFGFEYQRRRASAASPGAMTNTHLWAGKRFCEMVLAKGFCGAEGVYTFNSAGLELLTAARQQGLRAVMEQTIAPREIEAKLLKQEHENNSGWEFSLGEDTAVAEFIARERTEWAIADLILCGSEFVKESIAACGGPIKKCRVIPYGVDSRFTLSDRKAHGGPLRVLTVGAVGLRKGSPYVLKAARALVGQAEFRMVGSLTAQPHAQELLHSILDLTGPVPRSEIQQHFAWADVFLLPSLCEGSATVVYEALAAGLPVICTPNTGSVVRDGVDGFIVPIHDVSAILAALGALIETKGLLDTMRANARERAADFTLESYRQRLLIALAGESSITND